MSRIAGRDFVASLSARVQAGEPVVVATVVHVEGSASAQPGAKAILDASGRNVFGWVGGGCVETSVAEAARDALRERRPRLLRLDLNDEVLGVGMPCGGYLDVYIEPLMPAPKLLVLGHGRIAEALARLGRLMGFHVTVNDPLASEAAFPEADVCIREDPDYAKVAADPETYVVITTQHRSDYEALLRVLRERPGYVGVVASRKRSALLFERLFEDGFEPELLRRVRAPAGLDIGAATPQEIALSIFAEIATQYRGGEPSGRPLADVKGVSVTDDGVQPLAGSADRQS